MKTGCHILLENRGGPLRAVLLTLALLGIPQHFYAAELPVAPETQGSPTHAIVAHLQYREVDFAPTCWEAKVLPKATFRREPAFASSDVCRGEIVLDQATRQFLPFAWDITARKLYLDLNHNGDLTDDPKGVLTAPDKDLQLFRGIRLRFPSDAGPYDVLVDAHVFASVESVPGGQERTARVFLNVRSLWEGAVELSGKKWYLAVIDWPDGQIRPPASQKEIGDRMILRPWAERDQRFLWWHASLEYVHELDHVKLVNYPFRLAGNAEVFDAFNVPARLFVEGQAYRVECRVEQGGNLSVAFGALHPPITKLHLGGECIKRVVLDGGSAGFTAVLDAPAGEVEVPAGVYPRQLVLLQRAGFTNVAVGLGRSPLTVAEGKPAGLDAGGPLHNAVGISPTPADGTLRLEYLLTNSAGISFRLAFQDEKAPPKWEVGQGDAVVAENRFRFG